MSGNRPNSISHLLGEWLPKPSDFETTRFANKIRSHTNDIISAVEGIFPVEEFRKLILKHAKSFIKNESIFINFKDIPKIDLKNIKDQFSSLNESDIINLAIIPFLKQLGMRDGMIYEVIQSDDYGDKKLDNLIIKCSVKEESTPTRRRSLF